jgi:hypothetical protein
MKSRVNIVLAWGLLLMPSNVSANLQSNDESALRGLRGVFVTITHLHIESQPQSPTKDEIKSNVERWLHDANIRVLTREEMLNTPGQPSLEVIAGVNSSTGTCPVYYVEMRLVRKVSIENDPTLKTRAAVWQSGKSIGVGEKEDLSTDESEWRYAGYPVIFEEALRKKVNGFIASYLQANGK